MGAPALIFLHQILTERKRGKSTQRRRNEEKKNGKTVTKRENRSCKSEMKEQEVSGSELETTRLGIWCAGV